MVEPRMHSSFPRPQDSKGSPIPSNDPHSFEISRSLDKGGNYKGPDKDKIYLEDRDDRLQEDRD